MEGFPWQLSTDLDHIVGGSQNLGLGLTIALGAGGTVYLLTKEPWCRSITRSGLQWLLWLLEEKSEDVEELRTGDFPTPMMPSQRKLLQKSLLDLACSTPAMGLPNSKPSLPLSDSMNEMVFKARRVRQLIWETSFLSTDADFTLNRLDTSVMIPNSHQDPITEESNPGEDDERQEWQELNASVIRNRDNFWHLTGFPGSCLTINDRSLHPDLDGSLEVEVEDRTDPWEWDAAWDCCPSSPTSVCSQESGFSGSDRLTPSPPPSPTPLEEDQQMPSFPAKCSILPLWLSSQLTSIL